MPTNIKKVYNTFNGENLRSPELIRDQRTSTRAVNSIQTDNLSLSKRKGNQIQASGQGGSGAVTFNRTDIASGVQTSDRLVVDNNLHKELTHNIDITYTGIGQPNFSYLLNSSAVFEINLFVDGEIIATSTFGDGKTSTEVGTSAVVDFINSVANFSATDTGPGSNRAAFIKSIEFTDIPGTLEYKTFEQIPNVAGITETFPLHYSTRNNDDFELMQFAQTNDVLYITNGQDGLYKYDGERVYKAGMQDAEDALLITGIGALTGSYVYRYYYQYTDALGRIYNSNVSTPQEINLTSNNVTLSIPSVQDGSGWDTDGSRLEIIILRTQAEGTILYEIGRVSNDGSLTNVTYTDNADDSLLTIDFTPPVNNPRQPPIARYIDVFRNKLILTGNPDSVNEVFFSDVESPEGFPIGNRFLTRSRFGGPNSGVAAQDNYLYVFKPNSITVVTGSLDTLQFEVDILSDEGVGCTSANSILEASGKIYFLSRQGVYSVFNGQTPVEESDPHKPYYNTLAFTPLRVNSFNWIQERLLIWSLPVFDTVSGEKVLNKEETVLVTLDMTTSSWRTWKGMDISGGISLDNEDVWFNGKFEEEGGVIRTVNSEVLSLNTTRDYADHNEPISFEESSHWETLDEPSVAKNFNRIRVYSIDEPLENFVNTGFDLTVVSNFNYNTGQITSSSKSFVGGSEGWGEFSWGEGPWGDTPLAALQFNLSRKKCNSIRIVMKNDILHQNVLISGFEFEVSVPYRLAIKGNV